MHPQHERLTGKQHGTEVRVAENERRADTTRSGKGGNGANVEARDVDRGNNLGGYARCSGKNGAVRVRSGGMP